MWDGKVGPRQAPAASCGALYSILTMWEEIAQEGISKSKRAIAGCQCLKTKEIGEGEINDGVHDWELLKAKMKTREMLKQTTGSDDCTTLEENCHRHVQP